MAKNAEENAQIYARLVSLRERNPKRFHLVRIACKWDDLNSEYSRNGISELFCSLRKELKELIQKAKPFVGSLDLAEFSALHPDVYKDGKLFHGYNMNYVPVKR